MRNLTAGLVVITTVLLIVAFAGLILIRLHGEQLLSVQTASMVPVLKPGDAVIVRRVYWQDLQAGDIVSYHSPKNPNLIISHRLVKIDRQTGELTTAGDALYGTDPTFPSRLVAGKATAVLPKFGFVLNLLRHPLGLALVLYMPAAAVVVSEIRYLAYAYARPFYSARL